MAKDRIQLWLGLAAIVIFSPVRADDAIVIDPVEQWSSVFADSETRWTYRFSSEQPLNGPAAWRLTINHRLAANGEFDLIDDAKKVIDRKVALRWPKINAGQIQAAQLVVSIGTSRHERTVWLFPRDPFTDRRDWLKGLKLKVFDPNGETIARFTAADIPYESLRTTDAFDEVTEGIVIISEGCSLRKQDEVIDSVRQLAARGISVLCLASVDGQFVFPGEKPQPISVQLRRFDVICELDKRLDAAWWPKGSSQLSGLRFGAESDEVMAEVSDNAKAWPWCEWRYESDSDKQAHFIWCGFGLIRSWDDSPTPRYLLAAILERLSHTTKNLEPGHSK